MYDLIISGGMVTDGTGSPAIRADVAVLDGRIVAIGDLSGTSARCVLDASGAMVAPGFIDAHAHSDTSFLKDSSCASKLYQGVTTEITGQCGDSPFPAAPGSTDPWQCASFADFLDRFDREGMQMAVNQAILVGHGSLRAAVVGYEDRPVTDDELKQMEALLDRDLRAGAWGLSLGLEYAPGFFADAHELQALGHVAARHGVLVPCHMRSEGLHIDEALDELLSVGLVSGAHVHVSHLKLDNFRVHGQAPRVWQRLLKARDEGVNVTADMYPFTASCTTLTIRCPRWSREGGNDALLARLTGPRRDEIIEGIRTHYFNAGRAETCLFSDDGGLWPEITGKTLRFVAEEYLHTDDYAAAAAEVLLRTRARVQCIFFVMSEEDMLYFLSQDTGIGSDGWALSGDPALVGHRPHPRSYAAIPEFFRLARVHGLCSVEEAVRRVTSKAADMIGLADRGRLLPGLTADITVFDPETIAPRATYLAPIALSQGIRHVVIGGQIAMEDGVQTPLRCGRFLRHPSAAGIS